MLIRQSGYLFPLLLSSPLLGQEYLEGLERGVMSNNCNGRIDCLVLKIVFFWQNIVAVFNKK